MSLVKDLLVTDYKNAVVVTPHALTRASDIRIIVHAFVRYLIYVFVLVLECKSLPFELLVDQENTIPRSH